MAQEHLNSLITAAGIDQTDVDTILALPADTKDFKADEYVGKIKSGVETQLKNDPKFWEGLDENNVNADFKKKLEAQQYGRATGIVRSKFLKIVGLTEDDLADLSEEDRKKFETVVTKASEKFVSSKASDKSLQQDLITARQKIEELEAKIPETEGRLKTNYETQLNSEKLDFIFLAEIATVEGLKVPANYVADSVAKELKSTYAFNVSGMKADPKQKDNPNLAVLDGSKALSTKDLIIKILTRDGLIEDKKAGPVKGKVSTVDIEPEKGQLKMSSHIADKIARNTPV